MSSGADAIFWAVGVGRGGDFELGAVLLHVCGRLVSRAANDAVRGHVGGRVWAVWLFVDQKSIRSIGWRFSAAWHRGAVSDLVCFVLDRRLGTDCQLGAYDRHAGGNGVRLWAGIVAKDAVSGGRSA